MKATLAACAITILSAAAGTASADDWSEIRIGVESAYPPFSYVDGNGEIVGFDIDITRALCDAMEADCTLVEQDWASIIPGLLAKKYDAIVASMGVTPERDKRVDFTDKYYDTWARFAALKHSDIEITREGLKGKVVGVQRATVYDRFLTDHYSDVVEIRRYATQDEAYLDAASGRVDLLMADQIAMRLGFLETEAGQGWELVGPDFRQPEYFGSGIAIAVREGDDDLRRKFNAAIAAILANGTYRKIQDKYFDFNIYGEPYGDGS